MTDQLSIGAVAPPHPLGTTAPCSTDPSPSALLPTAGGSRPSRRQPRHSPPGSAPTPLALAPGSSPPDPATFPSPLPIPAEVNSTAHAAVDHLTALALPLPPLTPPVTRPATARPQPLPQARRRLARASTCANNTKLSSATVQHKKAAPKPLPLRNLTPNRPTWDSSPVCRAPLPSSLSMVALSQRPARPIDRSTVTRPPTPPKWGKTIKAFKQSNKQTNNHRDGLEAMGLNSLKVRARGRTRERQLKVRERER